MTPDEVAPARDREAAAGRRDPDLVDNTAIPREDQHVPARKRWR